MFKRNQKIALFLTICMGTQAGFADDTTILIDSAATNQVYPGLVQEKEEILADSKKWEELIPFLKDHNVYFFEKKIDDKTATLILFSDKNEAVPSAVLLEKKGILEIGVRVALVVGLAYLNYHVLKRILNSYPFWVVDDQFRNEYIDVVSRDLKTFIDNDFPKRYHVVEQGQRREFEIENRPQLFQLHLREYQSPILNALSYSAGATAIGYWIYYLMSDLIQTLETCPHDLNFCRQDRASWKQSAADLASFISEKFDRKLNQRIITMGESLNEKTDLMQIELISRQYIHPVAQILEQELGFDQKQIRLENLASLKFFNFK